ncbi:hypothetical protein C2G38_2170902 [Gigaspora rosea]|uniref:Uncharacterized protein n=1 Tax=Gigaspora rosea TaxID=44941 RepID=A0A397VM25_9GLOM|nr:hypothetical protein C2G38_2170902 [Gigaspora rosea]
MSLRSTSGSSAPVQYSSFGSTIEDLCYLLTRILPNGFPFPWFLGFVCVTRTVSSYLGIGGMDKYICNSISSDKGVDSTSSSKNKNILKAFIRLLVTELLYNLYIERFILLFNSLIPSLRLLVSVFDNDLKRDLTT